MGWTIWNPVAGFDLRFDDLISQSDPEARKIFEVAAAHAAYRNEQHARALDGLAEASFPERPTAIPFNPAVNGLDILVGLGVAYPAVLAKMLPHGISDEAAETLLRKRERLGPPPSSVTIDRDLVRKWIWNRRIGRWSTIDIEVIARSFSVAFVTPIGELNAMVDWDAGYQQGLHTHIEIWSAIAERIGIPFHDVPSCYLDRGGELRCLDGLVARNGGAFIVGTTGSGRNALASTWLGRNQCGETQPRVHFSILRVALSRENELVIFADASCIGTAYDPCEEPHLVIVAPELFERARGVIDPEHKLGVMELPPLRDDERVAVWLCATRASHALGRVLTVFADARREVPREPWSPFDANGVPLDTWLERSLVGVDSIKPAHWILQGLEEGTLKSPKSPRWRPIDPFVTRLADLLALERQLAEPKANP